MLITVPKRISALEISCAGEVGPTIWTKEDLNYLHNKYFREITELEAIILDYDGYCKIIKEMEKYD